MRWYRFAWLLIVGLVYAGSIVAPVVLHDLTASLILGVIGIVSLISQELYLMWALGGALPATEGRRRKPS